MGLLDKLMGRGKAIADKGVDLAGDVAEKTHLDDAAAKAKDVAGDVAEKTHLDDAAGKTKDVAGDAVEKGKDLLGGGDDKS